MYKNYIRLAADNKTIIKTFSTAFQKPVEGDILVGESEDRNYQLELMDTNGEWQYKYENNTVSLKTNDEIYTIEKKKSIAKNEKIRKLTQSDSKIIRTIEDLIDILVTKEVISLDDFSQAVKKKLSDRKELRAELDA